MNTTTARILAGPARPVTLGDHLKRGMKKCAVVSVLLGSAIVLPDLASQALHDAFDSPVDSNVQIEKK